MSTAGTLLDGVRYDLRNYADIDFDSTLMIHYLNRAIRSLDYALGAFNSDWTLNRDTVTLLTGADTVTVPTSTFIIREVWEDERRLEQLKVMDIRYKSEFRSSDSSAPNFWAHDQDVIRFEVEADADYTITVYFDKLSDAITAETSTMPYQGRFDDTLREATILLCEAKKYKNPQEADAMYARIFDSVAHHDMVNRRFQRKNYKLDF